MSPKGLNIVEKKAFSNKQFLNRTHAVIPHYFLEAEMENLYADVMKVIQKKEYTISGNVVEQLILKQYGDDKKRPAVTQFIVCCDGS